MEAKGETRGRSPRRSVLHEKDLEKIHLAIEHSVQGNLCGVRVCLESLSQGGLKLLELTTMDLSRQAEKLFNHRAATCRQKRKTIPQGLAMVYDRTAGYQSGSAISTI